MNPTIQPSIHPPLIPPSFPLRPVNGGPLPKAQPKSGRWRYEPKINEWRAWVHPLSGRMWNRHNEPLSITAEFAPVLQRLRDVWQPGWPAFLDCGSLSRRVPVGKGSLIVLDFVPPNPAPFDQRMTDLYQLLIGGSRGPIAEPWLFEQTVPPENKVLLLPYSYEDEATQLLDLGRPLTCECDNTHEQNHTCCRACWAADFRDVPKIDPDLLPTAAWDRLQHINRELKCELFEGLVAKRADSYYPLQLRSPDVEFPFWMKHRWQY